MKKIMLIVLLLSGLLMTGQSIDEMAWKTLGTTLGRNSKVMMETDYGSFTFKLKAGKGFCEKIIVTITNGQYNYKKIIENSKKCQVTVGSLWTDLIYTFVPIESKKFKTLTDAKKYYDSIDKSLYQVYNEIHIYKKENKEKYIVGIFNNDIPEYGVIYKGDAKGRKLDTDYKIVQ